MSTFNRYLILALAYGFGSGKSPLAPGTMGTLVAIPMVIACKPLSVALYTIIMLLMISAGIWICGFAASHLGVHDHPSIVWDEIAGYFITMWGSELTLLNIVLGFIIFRLFDITKPWPISWCDRCIKGGIGIMMDDLVAGIFACCLVHVVDSYPLF